MGIDAGVAIPAMWWTEAMTAAVSPMYTSMRKAAADKTKTFTYITCRTQQETHLLVPLPRDVPVQPIRQARREQP